MNGVNEIAADQLRYWPTSIETVDGECLCRPEGLGGLGRRFKKAWKVFTGQADVLVWHKQ